MARVAFDLLTSTTSEEAEVGFRDATLGVAGHRRDVSDQLNRVLAFDPDHIGAHVLAGFSCILLARRDLRVAARSHLLKAAQALRTRDGGTADERALVGALAYAAEGELNRACEVLNGAFQHDRSSLLPFKIAHSLNFMLGNAAAMLRDAEVAVQIWPEQAPGAGFVRGCYAFALEEIGQYAKAERVGLQAIAIEPRDVWGMHAVSHVREMRRETRAGVEWLTVNRPTWSSSNNFRHHISWHLALLHLDLGDNERALAIYDDDVFQPWSEDFRDLLNSVSLLARLEFVGLNVGRRWRTLSDVVQARSSESTLIFVKLHALIAMILGDDLAGAKDVLADIEASGSACGEQAEVARSVGVPLARALVGFHPISRSSLERLAVDLSRLGGSNAQRDIFVLKLAEVALETGDHVACSRILAARSRLKAQDRLLSVIDERLDRKLTTSRAPVLALLKAAEIT